MKIDTVAEAIPGYAYGSAQIPRSPVSLNQLELLKQSVGFTSDDERYLARAGEVLRDQTAAIVKLWRSEIIAHIPNLARHSRALDNTLLPEYLARSNRRFEQWIVDTCLRPYDQQWLDYMQEIAVRHTSLKKNKTDQVQSTDHIPLRDVIGFIAVINDTIKPYLARKGHSEADVDNMHKAWCHSLQLQAALFAQPYVNASLSNDEW